MTKAERWVAYDTPTYLAALDAIQRRLTAEQFEGLIRRCAAAFFKNVNALPQDFETIYAVVRATVSGRTAHTAQKTIDDPGERAAIAQSLSGACHRIDQFGITACEHASELDHSGLLRLPDLLVPEGVKALAAFLHSRPDFVMEGVLRKHRVQDIAAAPHALNLATDPKLVEIAASFLGCAPTLVNIEAWWSPASLRDDQGPEQLHRDKDDFRACKFFMYLTDVDEGDGPHVYVRHSHNPSFAATRLADRGYAPERVRDVFSMADGGKPFADLNREIFADEMAEITGQAGTAFIMNTFGLHRGKVPTRGERGIIAFTYAMIAYPERHERLAPIVLDRLPADCADTELTRYVTRLLFEPPNA